MAMTSRASSSSTASTWTGWPWSSASLRAEELLRKIEAPGACW
jgi:hypothetical protein